MRSLTLFLNDLQGQEFPDSASGRGFSSVSAGKEPAYSAGDERDTGLTLEWVRFPGGGNGNHSSLLAWRIPWTEEPGGLQPMGSQGVRHNLVTKHMQTRKGISKLRNQT